MAVDTVGTGPTGATNGAIGSGVIAFRTKVVLTTAGALDGTTPIQIGGLYSLAGVGVINKKRQADQARNAVAAIGAYSL